MKKIIIACALVCIVSISVLAQTIVNLDNLGQLKVITFIDSETGLVAGAGGIWRTANSGDTWENVYLNQIIHDFEMSDLTGYAVNGRNVIKTSNGGQSWQVVYSVPLEELPNLTKVSLRSDTEVYIGYSGRFYYGQVTRSKVLKSIDGGISWEVVYLGYGTDIRDMSVNLNGELCLVTDFAQYDTLWTKNIGGEWEGRYCPIAVTSVDNKTNGFIRLNGGEGRAATVVTTDRGTTWQMTLIEPVDYSICRGLMLRNNIGYSIATFSGNIHGCIYKTTNNANNWSQFSVMPSEYYSFEAVCFTDRYIYATGVRYDSPNNAAIFRYEINPLGIDPQGEIPKNFELKQNFPNPFNPSTVITYSIPKQSMVKITVYDSNGKELQTIVNGAKDAGKHEVSFNGSNFSSGVYFYKLVADDFIDTKKMILIK